MIKYHRIFFTAMEANSKPSGSSIAISNNLWILLTLSAFTQFTPSLGRAKYDCKFSFLIARISWSWRTDQHLEIARISAELN